jgi:hypothetical protein
MKGVENARLVTKCRHCFEIFRRLLPPIASVILVTSATRAEIADTGLCSTAMGRQRTSVRRTAEGFVSDQDSH